MKAHFCSMNKSVDQKLKWFRYIALAEGVSYLLFAVTMPLKYQLEIPEPNKVVGLIHGVLFMAYIPFAYLVVSDHKLGNLKLLIFWLASLLPAGTFVLDHKILKKL